MRTRRIAGLLACAASLALTTVSAAAPHPSRKPTLEGLWRVNVILPIEATPQTPNLVVPEAEAKVIGDALRKDWGELFAIKCENACNVVPLRGGFRVEV